MKLIDNLHAYVWEGNDNNCNSYVFADSLKGGKHLLIDPGHVKTPFYHEPGFEMLVKGMEQDGLDINRTGLVILTHAHGDHSESAVEVHRKSQALIAMHEAEEPEYQRLGGQADIYLVDGDLQLGEDQSLKLNVFHSPGHSPGLVTLYWPEQKVLIAGDLIFYHSTGRVDTPGGDPLALKKSILKLSQLDIDIVLCGHAYGHPGIISGKPTVRENFEFIKRNILF